LNDDSAASFPALSYAASGSLKLRLSRTGAYYGLATIGGIREPVAGQFDRFGYAPLVARRSTLSGSLQIDDAGLRIQGILTDGRKTSPLLLYRTAAMTNAAGLTGDYSIELPAAGSVGVGMITMRILNNGAVRIHGQLGDGTEFNERTFLSPDASIPLFAPLYGRRGVIMGWLNLSEQGTVQGSARWFRPGNSRNVNFPNGFGVVIPVTGSRSF
jgi:hypothetical protein